MIVSSDFPTFLYQNTFFSYITGESYITITVVRHVINVFLNIETSYITKKCCDYPAWLDVISPKQKLFRRALHFTDSKPPSLHTFFPFEMELLICVKNQSGKKFERTIIKNRTNFVYFCFCGCRCLKAVLSIDEFLSNEPLSMFLLLKCHFIERTIIK